MKHLLVCLLLFIFATTSKAAQFSVDLAEITNDITEETSILGINEEDGRITSFYISTYVGDQETKHEVFRADLIFDGVVLVQMQGIDVVTLKSSDFNVYDGGSIDITYLYSGVTKKYKTQTAIIKNSSEWSLYTLDETYFNHIFCKANKVFGKPVGIKQLYFNVI